MIYYFHYFFSVYDIKDLSYASWLNLLAGEYSLYKELR